ncbi:hypothetical protein STCU_10768 [Strigomonas culicis]|uniref:Uncharacterized protein n=1 Tax=Strigomonas culicis TaxID=28005 RepID=S9URI0_9TRYP|nr:hypothetical protein STCU_10768 [Strigomonas culicis]|eukprot:EPY17191.1 hypothetical protein STCU_10768 [Strigomonas culicis]
MSTFVYRPRRATADAGMCARHAAKEGAQSPKKCPSLSCPTSPQPPPSHERCAVDELLSGGRLSAPLLPSFGSLFYPSPAGRALSEGGLTSLSDVSSSKALCDRDMSLSLPSVDGPPAPPQRLAELLDAYVAFRPPDGARRLSGWSQGSSDSDDGFYDAVQGTPSSVTTAGGEAAGGHAAVVPLASAQTVTEELEAFTLCPVQAAEARRHSHDSTERHARGGDVPHTTESILTRPSALSLPQRRAECPTHPRLRARGRSAVCFTASTEFVPGFHNSRLS